ncbi:hypothetical protein JOD45_002610 [Scopulibacillus daqui]|uniref:Uncharacterized protein n=1 Tax=Scopulibacillus daqui TaxID=1469162 RepID=A0ABS2Q273_9BACL|nr:hypothetical protein [Scopulibacillus daqui]
MIDVIIDAIADIDIIAAADADTVAKEKNAAADADTVVKEKNAAVLGNAAANIAEDTDAVVKQSCY